jgi:hypothetical protein
MDCHTLIVQGRLNNVMIISNPKISMTEHILFLAYIKRKVKQCRSAFPKPALVPWIPNLDPTSPLLQLGEW